MLCTLFAAALLAAPTPAVVTLAVGPDAATAMVTASSRGLPAPPAVAVVYHDGTRPLRWAWLPVERRDGKRATPAEAFARANPPGTDVPPRPPAAKAAEIRPRGPVVAEEPAAWVVRLDGRTFRIDKGESREMAVRIAIAAAPPTAAVPAVIAPAIALPAAAVPACPNGRCPLPRR